MAGPIGWETRIGRRLRLRDLHVFFAVLQAGSMAKAAANMRVTQPSVSKAIGDLEAVLGVRLFDRSPHGVELTNYGDALRRCGSAVFDDLRQGIKEIEFLSDPTVGELRIGCSESVTSSILPPIIEQFSDSYPRVVFHIDVANAAGALPKLRERSLDLVIVPLGATLLKDPFIDELNVETLFEDRLVIAAGIKSPWARRRKIGLAELVHERWILPQPDTWNYEVVAEAFRARGLDLPHISIKTMSVHIRTNMLATGKFIAALPYSVLHLYADPLSLKVLPVDLGRPWPNVIVTLKNRRLSRVGERFLDLARASTKALATRPKSHGDLHHHR